MILFSQIAFLCPRLTLNVFDSCLIEFPLRYPKFTLVHLYAILIPNNDSQDFVVVLESCKI